MEVGGSTVDESEEWNANTGDDSVDRSVETTSSLHEVGSEGTANWYTLDKTSAGSRETTRDGNYFTGEYAHSFPEISPSALQRTS